MRQLRRAVGAGPSLKRQAKPDRRSDSRRARAILFVPKKTVEQQDIQASIGSATGGREGTLSLSGTIRRSVGWSAGALTCVPQPERAEPMPRALLGAGPFCL